MFTLELADDGYRIVGPDGQEGELADYGVLATLKVGDILYAAMMEDAETGDMDLEIQVYQLTPVETSTEDVDFEVEEDDDSGDDDTPVEV